MGFDTDGGGTQPPGKVTGTAAALWLDAARNNTFAALNRAWKLGARVAGARYVVGGSPPRSRTNW